MNKSKFILLTLASNDQSVIIDRDNIAFAIRMEDKNDKGKTVIFTRIYLKQVVMLDDSKWVDVIDAPESIMKK